MRAFSSVALLVVLVTALVGAAPARAQERFVAGTAALHCASAKTATFDAGEPGGVHAPSAASEAFDAGYYHLTLDLDPISGRLQGHTRVSGRASGAALDVLALDLETPRWIKRPGRTDSTLQGMTVDSVRTPEGQRLAFTHTADRLAITLPAPAPPGATVAVDVFYGGLPVQSGFGTYSYGRFQNNNPYVWTLSEPYGARAWWPCKDHPSDKADSVRVTVTVPEPLAVGSNGLLRAETHAGGRATFDWAEGYPIATYLVSVAAGVYERIEQRYLRPDSLAARYGPLDLPVLHYQYEGSNQYEGTSATFGWKYVVDVMAVLESWFGSYPFPAEKYGHAQFTWGGAMEHQTMSSMGSSSVDIVAHELAHQWFGDAVSPARWPHLWLNEGFATYAELLYWEAMAERHPDIHEYAMESYRNRARSATGTLVVEDTTSISNLFSGNRVYAKGGLVVHMLRGVLGDAVFRQVLQAYVNDPSLRYGSATTADFRRVAERVSGRDLGAFFDQWVTGGTGYPTYEVAWGARKAGAAYDVAIRIDQLQTAPASNREVFVMPITVDVRTKAGMQRFTLQNDLRSQTFVVQVDAEPLAVHFDPLRYVLRNDQVRITNTLDVPTAPRESRVVALFPNPAVGTLHVDYEVAYTGSVEIEVFDLLGRRVRTLVASEKGPGAHDAETSVADLPAGAYFVRLSDVTGVRAYPFTVMR